MAKAITAPVAGRRPATAGSWILLAISVAVGTVLAVSVPHLIGSSGWMSGEKFLYISLVAYLGASALYIASLAVRHPGLISGGVALTRGGFLVHTTAVLVRWASSGHAPFSSMFEMVLMFSWGVVAMQLLAEWKFELKDFGAITIPIAALALILMQVLPGEVRPLVPALQSTWLQIHVTLAVLSYAGLTLAFAAGILYFVKDATSPRTFLYWIAGLSGGIYAAIALTCVDREFNLLLPAWDVERGEKVMLAPKQALMVPLAGMGWPVLLALALGVVVLALNRTTSSSAEPGKPARWTRHAFQAFLLLQVVTLVALIVKVQSGPHFVTQVGRSFETRFTASPFVLAGLATALFISLAWLVLDWKYQTIVEYLPHRDTLDDLIYKSVAISFPLLTLMIIAGAYWANKTWGNYWSWDPKEDWALITWLTYAGYIHMRLTRGWRGRRAAYMAIIGFAIVLFTFFGVSYLLPGLHAYA